MAASTHLFLTLLAASLKIPIETARAEQATPCTTACGCAIRLQKRGAVYVSEAKEAALKAAQNRADFETLILAAAHATGPSRRKHIPVLATAAKIIHKCETALANTASEISALANATNTASTLMQALHVISGSAGRLEITWTGGNNFNQAAATTKTFAKLDPSVPCPDGEAEQSREYSRDTELTEPDIPDLLNQVYLENSCDQDGRQTDCNANSVTNGAVLSYALKLAKGKGAPTNVFAAAAATPEAVTVNDFKLATAALEDANSQLRQRSQDTSLNTCKKTLRDFSNFKSEETFIRLVQQALAADDRNRQTGTSDADAINAIVTETYGTNDKDFSTKYWASIDTANAPKVDGNTETTEELRKLKTLELRGEALARLFLKELVAEETKQKSKQKLDNTKDKECSNKKGTECTGECEWDEEKKSCTPKKKGEKTNQETEGKTGTTTDTAASNSFLINKAPLLLAVLLF
uniref:Variant surface glycoprotein 1125.53 n=1 Tax=Trypanosoma brucei TaxID=5691 RepID=A0A1J0R444_9TRYP|nr:variant surface glycoprotein 1125.53 [Trypanosoma brucei]